MGAEGFILKINKELVTNLQNADKAIESLDKHTTEAYEHMKSAFDKINGLNLDKFIATINSAKEKLSGLGDVNIKINATGLDSISNMSKEAMDSVIKLSQSLSNVSTANISSGKVASSSNLFDLSGLEQQRKNFQSAIAELERQISTLHPKLQNLLKEKYNIEIPIKTIGAEDINRLQAHIENIKAKLAEVGNASGRDMKQSVQPYIEALHQLEAEIEKVKKSQEEMIPQAKAEFNPAIQNILKQYDDLYAKIRDIMSEDAKLAQEMANKQKVNDAIQAQVQKIADLKQQLKDAEIEFERLKATGGAYKSDGTLTQKAKDIIAYQNQIKEEIKLQEMSASQAEKYAQSKINAAKKETDAKIAEYDKLLKKIKEYEAQKLQAESIKSSTTDVSIIAKADQSIRDSERLIQESNARKLELERQLGGELIAVQQKYLGQELTEYQKNTTAKIAEYDKLLAKIREIEQQKSFASELSATTQDSKTKTKADTSVKESEKQLQELNKRKLELENELQDKLANVRQKYRNRELQEAIRAAEIEQEKKRRTYDGAMDYSKNAKNILEERQAIKYLEAAREKLDKTDANYSRQLSELNNRILEHRRNINSAIEGSKELQKSHRNLMDISGQLARKLALVFSVSQIQGYIQKLVEVRGEFELNQRALQAMLQNKQMADEIWNKTVELAVQSPFRVKELVSYTKQLAAYRIEADKLYETNKMLADISAGLGVDMQRLILAFGQVRSAAYLRGTELRQFTEAGIPILEELSKYFTELEGRVISVGDVFEMVSKRMVLFEDVQEVFKRMTSESGVFFNMQEIQAETLKGQISNLKDSFDIMLNEIGKANEGTIKGVVKSVRILIENYKDIIDATKMWAVVLSPTISILTLNRIATSNLGKSIFNLITNTNKGFNVFAKYEKWLINLKEKHSLLGSAVGVFGKALGGLGIGLAVAGFSLLVKWITKTYLEMTEASRVAKRLKESLEGIFTEDTGELNKSIDTYTNLVARLNEANQGSKERREIISRLNNEYGEYLNFVVDENTTVQQLTESYDSLVKSMKERASLSTYQKGIEKIEESYGQALENAKDSFYELFEGTSVKIQGGGLSDAFKAIVPSKQEIDDIYSLLIQKIETLDSDAIDSLSEQQNLIQEIVKGYYGDEFFLSRDYTQSIKLIDILIDKKKQEEKLQDEINARYRETLRSREANLAMQELENKYKESQKEIRGRANLSDFEVNKMLAEIQQKFELDKIELKFQFGEISEQEMQEQKDRIINWATATVASVNENIKTKLGGIFSEEELSRVLITQEKQARGINSIVEDIRSRWEAQNKIIADNISLKSAGLKIDEKQQQSAERLKKLYEEVAKILGIELKETRRMSEEMRYAVNDILPSDFQITLEDAYRGIDAIISDLKTKEKEQVTIIEQINKAKESGLYFTEEELAKYDESLKKAEEEYYWIKKKLELIDPSTKNPISVIRADDINAKLEEKYQLDAIDRQKTETELLQETAREKDAAIAREAQLVAMKEQGVTVTEEELALARKDIEQLTLRWKLLGGTEKEKKAGSRSNSLYDERIKVIDDMNKKFKELNKTLDKGESIQGAFESYIDAFTTAFEGIDWIPKNAKEMSPQEFLTKVLNFTDENKLVEFLDKLAKEPMKAFEKIKVELAKGKYVYDMKVKANVEMDEDLQEKVQDMFDQYELSVELKKLNIPDDLAKSLFNIDVLNLDELKNKVADTFMGVEFYNERIKDAGKIMHETFNGNVDLLNRKLIPAIELTKKGWEDVGDGLATVFSSSYTVNDNQGREVEILVTPILPDGTVMSQDELEKYISDNLEGVDDILAADKKGIVINTSFNSDDSLGEFLHSLQEVYYAQDMLSEDMKEKYKDFLDKIDDLEKKAAKERMKTYSKYLMEEMSDRVKLRIETLKKIKEIEESKEFKPEQKERIIGAIKEESKKEEQKMDWEDFKNTDMYSMMFEDIEYLGTKALETLKGKLDEFKSSLSDLPASDVKEIMSQIEKIEDVVIKRNPFASLRETNRDIKSLKEQGKTEDVLQQDYIESSAKIDEYQKELDIVNTIISAKEKALVIENEISDAQNTLNKYSEDYSDLTAMSVDELNNRKEVLSSQTNILSGDGGGSISIEQSQEELDIINEIIDAKERIANSNQEISDSQNTLNEYAATHSQYTSMDVSELNNVQSVLNKNLKTEKKSLQNAEKGLRTYKKSRKEYADAAGEIEQIGSNVDKAFSSIRDILESVGVESDSVAGVLLDAGQNMTSLIFSAITMTLQFHAMGVAANSAMGIIGWIALALQAIATLLKAIFSAKDKALEKQIDEQKRKIEALQKAYDKLKEKVDDAYSIKDLQKYNEEMKKNLELQIEAQKIAIAAQEQRKGAQREGSKAWEELQDMQEELDEMMEKQVERWEDVFSKATDGILDNVLDAARDFTDAWWDAFQETGDGLSGLEGNFNEMISNMIKQQAAMTITSAFVEKWKKDLGKYLNEDDLELTADEAKSWMDEVRATLPQLSENLQNVWGEMADLLKQTTESGNLSELSKGISSASEESIEILTAYANSIRFINQDSNEKLGMLLNNFANGNQISNDMLAELRTQTRWMRDIYNLINGLTTSYSGGGSGIKVVM